MRETKKKSTSSKSLNPDGDHLLYSIVTDGDPCHLHSLNPQHHLHTHHYNDCHHDKSHSCHYLTSSASPLPHAYHHHRHRRHHHPARSNSFLMIIVIISILLNIMISTLIPPASSTIVMFADDNYERHHHHHEHSDYPDGSHHDDHEDQLLYHKKKLSVTHTVLSLEKKKDHNPDKSRATTYHHDHHEDDVPSHDDYDHEDNHNNDVGPPKSYGPPPPSGPSSYGPSAPGMCKIGFICINVFECDSIESNSNYDECELFGSDVHGVCCPSKGIAKTSIGSAIFRPLEYQSIVATVLPHITINDLNHAATLAKIEMKELLGLELELERRGLLAAPQSQDEKHHRFFSDHDEARNQTYMGYVSLRTTVHLINRFKLNHMQARIGLKQLSFHNSAHKEQCDDSVYRCNPRSKYRSADGSCNNLNHPDWGKSFTPFNRIMTPDYGDAVDAPRRSSSGEELPNARVVSFTLSPMRRRPSKFFTHVLMQWGQFIDHDMARTAISRAMNGQGLLCCNRQFDLHPELVHPACFAIEVPEDDPFYSQFRSTCMSVVRSAPAPAGDCIIGPREQLNQNTPYLDAGMIYGETEEASRNLRTFNRGKLKTSTVDGRDFLPQTNLENCNIPPRTGLRCFMAGDTRVNMQISLVTLQALFLRHHNRLCDRLSGLNPHWSDETVYQEVRKLVYSQVQHITYNEYLPLIIGRKVMETFDLSLSDHLVDLYDESINPQILSVFSSAAFRLHTTVRSTIPFRDNVNNVIGDLDLSDTFLNPSIVYSQDAYPEMLNGMVGVPMASFDRFFTTEVTHHLFRAFNASFGLDLVAINIQRGRDHGIPGYMKWRKICGLSTANTFGGMTGWMDPEAVKIISGFYQKVEDVDLFVGGTSEFRLKGASVGPTFACLIAEQFRRLKYGDRFWHENRGRDSSFSEEQLREVKKTTLASIFCEEREVGQMQRFAFIREFKKWNPRLKCDRIPKLDLRAWKRIPSASGGYHHHFYR